jgi:nitroimidazol reductase NimA-like FMN-containing flavoprotein (pyridoxamine 5'-phosphate oxidase superfamily)
MNVLKIPLMNKKEYDELIHDENLCRIAFQGEYPYIAPFLYVFDGKFLYFLSTKYGKKIELFSNNPKVAVEIEKYSENLTDYKFVTLQGSIREVVENNEKLKIKEYFVNMIKYKNLSSKILAALGHSPGEPLESLLNEDKSFVWKLIDVANIIGLKDS